MVKAIEIEIDGSRNENLHFRPLQRSVRGAFDLNRIAEPLARLKQAEIPTVIPSQRLGIDRDGVAYLSEPLHAPEHAAIKEKITARGMKLKDELTTFPEADLATWLYWLARAVDSGIAKVTKGRLTPLDEIEGEPRKRFILPERQPTSADRLAAALERQSGLMEKLLSKLGEQA